ncbi:hypothetical protein [Diaphorobacter ruginosibacter]|uniref:hypothetical protein n=1 Tax=Diaphorobacter ruginosibacter TaxID=1715720 RepID=UPI003342BDC1
MKKFALTLAALACTSAAYAFMPQAGTWIVTSENNGQPGRGFGLDVQDSTLVMQMYAYQANGNPTFYLSAGQISNDQYSAPLNEYSGGRYFGSGDRNGVQTGSAGNVAIRFTSGTTGFITFPGEAEKAISRYSFGYSSAASSLRGIWLFSRLDSLTPVSDFVQLSTITSGTSTGNGVVVSADGRFGCEQQVSGSLAGTVLCVRLTTSGALERGYQFVYSVNDGDGLYLNSSGNATSIAVMRRLGNTAGTGTGVLIKSDTADDEPAGPAQTLIGQLRSRIEQLSQAGLSD